MPLCQSALAGFIAAELTDLVCEMNDINPTHKELYKAGACATVGGAVGVATVDPVGLGIVAAETVAHLIFAAMGGAPEGAKAIPPNLWH
jgi:hypothetical protein